MIALSCCIRRFLHVLTFNLVFDNFIPNQSNENRKHYVQQWSYEDTRISISNPSKKMRSNETEYLTTTSNLISLLKFIKTFRFLLQLLKMSKITSSFVPHHLGSNKCTNLIHQQFVSIKIQRNTVEIAIVKLLCRTSNSSRPRTL